MRGRSYSYSPSPPRGYRRRGRSPSPRGRYEGRGRDFPITLLVRNLRHDCRPEDLRRCFAQFGSIKDVYLPRDYYTGQPRGFGFVQYIDPEDATEAKHQMDGQNLHGRELTVVFAEENRKKPAVMRARERLRGRLYDRRQSSPCYPRSPRYARSRSCSPGVYSPVIWRRSRSVSPQDRMSDQEPSYSLSPPNSGSSSRSRSPSRSRSRSRSHTPDDDPRNAGRERSSSQ